MENFLIKWIPDQTPDPRVDKRKVFRTWLGKDHIRSMASGNGGNGQVSTAAAVDNKLSEYNWFYPVTLQAHSRNSSRTKLAPSGSFFSPATKVSRCVPSENHQHLGLFLKAVMENLLKIISNVLSDVACVCVRKMHISIFDTLLYRKFTTIYNNAVPHHRRSYLNSGR